jgi:branched-chain amino acid transport system permease protein
MFTLELVLQAAVSGLLMGGIYALIALSLALVFGVMRVLNFAHGDLLMVGMYGVCLLNRALGLHPYWSALLLLPVMALLGWAVFRILIRPLLRSGVLMQAQLTIGLSFVIQSIALIVFGADLLNVRTGLDGMTLKLHGIVVSLPLLIGFAVSVFTSGVLSWFLLRTELGYRIRATAQDPVMAVLCGVAVPQIQKYVFAGSIGLLAVAAGCLMTFYYVTPFVGVQFSVLSLLVVVLGGLGDLRGAFVGGLIIGVAEAVAGAAIDGAAAPAVIYVMFGAVLLMRPRGLFGRGSEA